MKSNTLDSKLLKNFIITGLDEDIKEGDHTSLACIPQNKSNKAKLLVKDHGVIAGVEVAQSIFKHLDSKAEFDILKLDGSEVEYGDIAFFVHCNTRALLMGERLALNTMQRLSGISSLSRSFYDATKHSKTTILDTRKTTPGMRFLEKWAVTLGGCSNYRSGLYDWIMIKDNHIDAAGGIKKAIDSTNRYLLLNNLDLGVTIEVRNLDELEQVLDSGSVTRIMLDNFDIETAIEAVNRINGRFETEISGGVKLNVVEQITTTGVDFISVGALTHSARSLDLSLKIIK